MKICFERDNPNSTFYFKKSETTYGVDKYGRPLKETPILEVYTLRGNFVETIRSDAFNFKYILLEELRDQKIGEILNG